MLWKEFTSDLGHLYLSNLSIFECSSSSFPLPCVHLPLKSSPHSWPIINKIISALIILITIVLMGFPGGSYGKESTCNLGDLGSIPGLGRSSGEGNGNPLQCSCWRIPWTEKPDRLQPMGPQRVRHDLVTDTHMVPIVTPSRCVLANPRCSLTVVLAMYILNSFFCCCCLFVFLPGHTLKTSLYLLKPTTIFIFTKTLRTPLVTQGQNTKK